MRKTILYLVILGLLGYAIYYFLISDRNGSPFSADEAGFNIKDTAGIGKIFIAASNGESVSVVRTDSGWMVNNQYKALPSTVNLVLITLATQEALYPVTKNAYENVIRALSTDAIKVELYGRDGKKIKTIYVGGTAVNNSGTNMLIEGAKTPYVVRVAGFNGYLTTRFPTAMKDWRDRTIFNILPDEIQSISVQYAGKAINSFVLTREKDTDLVMTGDENITKNMGAFNKRRAKVYLRYFTNVNCEGYLNGLEDMDTTIKMAPKQSTIEVTGRHGQHQRVEIYWMALNRRSKNMTVSNPDIPDDYDADRLYAIINNNRDTVMIQQWAFRDIFHKSYEFFEKDVAPAKPGEKEQHPNNVMMHKDH